MTLIELLIGMAILALILSLGLPSVSDWMQNTQVRSAAESIQSGLQLARAEAVKRNTFVGFTMAGPDSSWSVDVMNPPAQIQSRTSAEGSGNAQIATTNATIIFDGLGKTSLAADATIQVTNPTGGACKTTTTPGMNCLNVTVSVGGQVKMCDPIINPATGDTRAC
ncbi:MAG: GspH/FimT family pseudopilin [Betaproteobacteria bacterium]|nr:MAG: GspH/FimT family pseudopilin [Betaproteobacteria bacterium]